MSNMISFNLYIVFHENNETFCCKLRSVWNKAKIIKLDLFFCAGSIIFYGLVNKQELSPDWL